jgi:hypothetical protein
VIRTFPETGLIIGGIQGTVMMAAPIPLAMLIVNQVVFDILPTTAGLLKCSLIMEILVDVVETHYRLSLNPPMEVIILSSCS